MTAVRRGALNPASPMTSARTIIGEVVRALAVLALVFLSFAPIAGDGGA